MILAFCYYIETYCSFINLHSIICRSVLGFITSIFLCIFFGKYFIKKVKMIQLKENPIRTDGPRHHLITKKKIPSMGGILIITTTWISSILWGNLSSSYLWIVLVAMLSFGILGFVDDYVKIHLNHHSGLSAQKKFYFQVILSAVFVTSVSVLDDTNYHDNLIIPCLSYYSLNIGLLYIGVLTFLVVGFSNAVNLTDGLDGLASGSVSITTLVLTIVTYLVTHSEYARYFNIVYLLNGIEICLLCMSILGSTLGFLFFNKHPAKIFMGDTGSLSLGATISIISILIKKEILFAITAFLFIIEVISVILQVMSYKLWKKRIFRMTPIHHHFEELGYKEQVIVKRLLVFSLVFGVIGLSTLII